MSDVEYVKMRIKPIKVNQHDFSSPEGRGQQDAEYHHYGEVVHLKMGEVKSVRRDIATAWVSAATIVEILQDLGSY